MSEISISVNDNDTVAQRRQRLYDRIANKPVVLVGASKTAAKFCNLFRDKLNISCLLTDNKDEEKITLKSKEVIYAKPYDKDLIKDLTKNGELIIVCRDGESYGSTKKLLIKDDFVFGKDFISEAFAETVLYNKKIISIIGYCQLMIFYRILKQVENLSSEYCIKYFSLIHDAKKGTGLFNESICYTHYSDITIYVPHIAQTKYKATVDYSEIAAPDAVKFRYPQLSFRGLHPYKDNDLRTKSFMTSLNVKWPSRPFQYAEPYLDQLVEEGKTNREILDIVLKDDFIPEKTILKNFKLALRSIQLYEAKSDLVISDYIMDNYKRVMLYKDCLHYENNLYYEIARRIVTALGICSAEEITKAEENNEIIHMDITQIPVLPCVAKTLGIEYADDDCEYRFCLPNNEGVITLTRNEWIEEYCDLARAAKVLKKYHINKISNKKG